MKKVFLETFGCQMNVSDSERVATSLEKRGYAITKNESAADIVLNNTSSVREKAENKLYTRVGEIRNSRENKPLIGVLGCVAQLEGETLFKKADGIDMVIGTQAVGRVPDAIENVLAGGEFVTDLGRREDDYDWSVSEKQRNSPYVAFIPIIEGCNKFCTYCIVPFSRGREISLSASEIIRHVLTLRSQGIREVHLIGQNVNSYRPKTDSGLEAFAGVTPFSRLLRAVAATGIERIKFNTSFPRDFHPDIVDAIDECENLSTWVHLPIQSGSDRILKAMKRGHTFADYMKRIEKIRSAKRDIALTTDIIVGFPGETREDFLETKRAVELCGYDMAYIFKYSPRFGTPAWKMPDDVSADEKTERFLELERTQKQLQAVRLERYVGRVVKVLAERRSTRSPEDLTGHSECHKLVNFKGDANVIGNEIDVRITKVKSNSLYGESC
jgi:tRNA-2-methylthio-N6-dimethylallyladenosine synthase